MQAPLASPPAPPFPVPITTLAPKQPSTPLPVDLPDLQRTILANVRLHTGAPSKSTYLLHRCFRFKVHDRLTNNIYLFMPNECVIYLLAGELQSVTFAPSYCRSGNPIVPNIQTVLSDLCNQGNQLLPQGAKRARQE
jgi:hypothetical protein